MKKLLILFIPAMAFVTARGQDTACSLEYRHMAGVLGRDTLVADLVISNMKVSGTCVFPGLKYEEGDSRGMTVTQRLEGMIDTYGVATLKAWEESIEKGEYSGLMGSTFAGSFRPQHGTAVRPFSMEEEYSGSIPLKGYCLEGDSALVDTAGSPSAHIRLALLLPEDVPGMEGISDDILKAFFGQTVRGNIPDDSLLDVFSNEYFNKYIEANIDIYEGGHSFSWDMIAESDVLMNRSGILVYRADNYAFTGGAHGLGVSRFLVFDTGKMQKIELQDIFIPGYEEPLSQMLENSLRRDYYLEDGQPLTAAGLFEERIAPTVNFFLTENSIGFFYNPYEIAPYAMGGIAITLRPEDVSHMLREGSIPDRLWAGRPAQ